MTKKSKAARRESADVSPSALGGFNLAKKYRRLAGAPLGEFETCETFGIIKVNLNGTLKSNAATPRRQVRRKQRGAK